MIKEAIILAGGLGTRLRPVVADLPKCMAPVNNKPFLTYVIDHLQKQGIEKFIFSLGYKHENIVAFLETSYPALTYKISIEDEPLGTGGAIGKSCGLVDEKSVIVVNGDTLFKADLVEMSQVHDLSGAHCTLALKPMKNFDRYGVVEIDNNCGVHCFKEKKYYESGLINGGVYALNKNKFLEETMPEKFSFESDYLEKFFTKRTFLGFVQDKYFIDIGIPEDFARAQEELK